MKIKIIETGGTIDKEYNSIDGELEFPNPHIKDMITRANLAYKPKIEILMLKDSLDFTDKDRKKILNSCLRSKEEFILISHGTDTMDLTADFLKQNIKNKKIVLFGAMIPYTIDNSDAFFNLGFALSTFQFVKNGVYIAMNGELFVAGNVRKNKIKGKFENLISSKSKTI